MEPGGLYYMPRGQPPRAVLTSYFGTAFVTPRGLAVRVEDGSVWFTEAGVFDAPRVFRFEPETGDVRAMAGPGGLIRPWGIAVDGETVYVVDAGMNEKEVGAKR